MSTDDTRWMRVALGLAARGLGQTWPNPSVGCVIVKDGRLVGRGWTAPGGRPHAEPQALAQAGAAARGATAYVTLEPCAHHGQTPPCADALAGSGIARVVTALQDPDPRVNGGGLALLRAKNIQITTDVCAQEAQVLNAGFLSRIQSGRPRVTLKLATTFDGRIATSMGHSQWITDALARAHVHGERARHDAIMVGGGTARADDPQLTVRGFGARRQPVRIIVSKGLDIPCPSALTNSLSQAPLWLCHDTQTDASTFTAIGAVSLPLPLYNGHIDVIRMMERLGSEGLTRVYCEGGGTLAASLLRAGLVDEIHGYTAGKIIGGDGLPGIAAMGIETLAQAPRFDLIETRALGPDLFHRWRPMSP